MNLENRSFTKKQLMALNPNIPLDVLRELAKDEDEDVRGQVAANPNTPMDALRDLAQDEKWLVRYCAAENPKASSKILVMLFEYEKSLKETDADIIRALYAHKNLPTFAKRVIETLFKEML